LLCFDCFFLQLGYNIPWVACIFFFIIFCRGAQWLRHCATNWKVAGSVPDDVTGFLH
jgi:hypothetical protein